MLETDRRELTTRLEGWLACGLNDGERPIMADLLDDLERPEAAEMLRDPTMPVLCYYQGRFFWPRLISNKGVEAPWEIQALWLTELDAAHKPYTTPRLDRYLYTRSRHAIERDRDLRGFARHIGWMQEMQRRWVKGEEEEGSVACQPHCNGYFLVQISEPPASGMKLHSRPS